MARFLHSVQAKGIRISVDVVSDSSGNFAEKVSPALKYCDYAIVNEMEGCAVSGLSPRDESGKILVENIQKSLVHFMELGVRHRAVIHCPEAGFCMDRDTGFCVVPSLSLPDGYIKGSAVRATHSVQAVCTKYILNIQQKKCWNMPLPPPLQIFHRQMRQAA